MELEFIRDSERKRGWGLTPKFRGARLAWPKRAVVEASPATPS